MSDPLRDLIDFLDRSPTPYHAVRECAHRLEAAGFERLEETDAWALAPGDRRYVVRGGGSLIAFVVGTTDADRLAFRIIGAHTDSPNLRVKPSPDFRAQGYHQLGVEPYGGVLLHTWLDRNLSLAGRVTHLKHGAPTSSLVDLGRPILCIPSLAIHLQREIREYGVQLNPQTHMPPICGLDTGTDLADLLAAELSGKTGDDIVPNDILAFDLMTYDPTPPAIGGADGEFLFASRLDNLASCHAAVSALAVSAPALAAFSRAIALYDHEEVGSRSAQGAHGTFLPDVTERMALALGGEREDVARACARSLMVSVDMAHAVHPSYPERHEPAHHPVIGRGPVVKVNAGQSYASDATTSGWLISLARRSEVAVQHFVARSDTRCGSTIGPIAAASVGIPTVDIGNPMLAMHSCREMAGTGDVEPMTRILVATLTDGG